MVEIKELDENCVGNGLPNSDKAEQENPNSAPQELDINTTSRSPVNSDQPTHEVDEATNGNPNLLAPWDLDGHDDDEDSHEVYKGKQDISKGAADNTVRGEGETLNVNGSKRVTIDEFLDAEKQLEPSESRDDQPDQQDTSMAGAIGTPVETGVGLVKKKRKNKSKSKSKRGLVRSACKLQYNVADCFNTADGTYRLRRVLC